MDENAERVPENTVSILRQTKGCFTIVETYLQWLREYGLYEDATIVILGDHGYTYWDTPQSGEVKTALFFKPGGSGDDFLEVSDAPVSHANFAPSILDAAGGDFSAIGMRYADVPEDAVNPRLYYHRFDPDDQTRELEVFEIQGDPSCFDNWEIIEKRSGSDIRE